MGIKRPDKLSDKQFAKAYQAFLFIRNTEREFYINILREVVSEAFGNKQTESNE